MNNVYQNRNFAHTVLLAEQLEAGVTDLHTGLAEVDRDNFTHGGGETKNRGG